MKSIAITTSGTSVSSVAATNSNCTPISIEIAIVVTGAATYTLQYTLDDVYATTFNPATATWFTHPTLAAGQTATKDAQITWPVKGIRVNQTAGAGSTAAVVLQAGI